MRVISLFLILTMLVSPGGWWTFKGDESRSGYREEVLGGGGLVLKWEFYTGDDMDSSVVVDGSGLYAATAGGRLLKLDVERGELLWAVNLSGDVSSTPTVDGRRVYIGDDNGVLWCVDGEDGSLLWNLTADGAIKSSPLVALSSVIFTTYGGSVYRVDPDSGIVAWKKKVSESWIHTSPSFSEGRVFFGGCDGNLYCLSLSTGELLWNFTASYIPSSPAVSGGRVYFGSYDQYLYCLNSTRGALIWKTRLGGGIYSSPAVGDGLVVVGCDDGKMYSLRADNGEIVWSCGLSRRAVKSSPALLKGAVIAGTERGIVLISSENGSITSELLTGDTGESSPAIFGGEIYWGDKTGYIRCAHIKRTLEDDEIDEGGGGVDYLPLLLLPALLIIIIILLHFRRRRG